MEQLLLLLRHLVHPRHVLLYSRQQLLAGKVVCTLQALLVGGHDLLHELSLLHAPAVLLPDVLLFRCRGLLGRQLFHYALPPLVPLFAHLLHVLLLLLEARVQPLLDLLSGLLFLLLDDHLCTHQILRGLPEGGLLLGLLLVKQSLHSLELAGAAKPRLLRHQLALRPLALLLEERLERLQVVAHGVLLAASMRIAELGPLLRLYLLQLLHLREDLQVQHGPLLPVQVSPDGILLRGQDCLLPPLRHALEATAPLHAGLVPSICLRLDVLLDLVRRLLQLLCELPRNLPLLLAHLRDGLNSSGLLGLLVLQLLLVLLLLLLVPLFPRLRQALVGLLLLGVHVRHPLVLGDSPFQEALHLRPRSVPRRLQEPVVVVHRHGPVHSTSPRFSGRGQRVRGQDPLCVLGAEDLHGGLQLR
mmetsp:Transcript_77933/g.174411  ORF Transcript_77933/g.174411 Transcript_77933/m.174411 type:complete len:416 (-) Transcript_77933:14-1261(-)